jgi:hypothetical protein
MSRRSTHPEHDRTADRTGAACAGRAAPRPDRFRVFHRRFLLAGHAVRFDFLLIVGVQFIQVFSHSLTTTFSKTDKYGLRIIA